MAPHQAVELESSMTTAEIKAGNGMIGISIPLSLARWDISVLLRTASVAVVRSADGDVFVGSVYDVDADRRSVTVELS